jgi:thiaminase
MQIHKKTSKGTEEKIREKLKEASETLSHLEHTSRMDMEWITPSIQAYTAYLNYVSQERSLKQIRITALATVGLAVATFILALITALHP